jgi:MFS family permease
MSPKRLVVANCIISILGYIGLALSSNLFELYSVMFIFGISASLNPTVAMSYIMEYFDHFQSSKVGLLIQVLEMSMAFVGPMFFIVDNADWTILYDIGLLLPILSLILTIKMTESPSYLMKYGKISEC